MPWSDKSVSPCVYTPTDGDSGLVLGDGLSTGLSGKIVAPYPRSNLILELLPANFTVGITNQWAKWVDSSGSGNTMLQSTEVRKPALSSDIAFTASGGPDCVISQDYLSTPLSRSFTGYIYVKNPTNANARFFCGNNGYQMMVGHEGTNRLRFCCTAFDLYSTTLIDPTSWHVVAFSVDASGFVKLFFNGALKNTSTAAFNDTIRGFIIGASADFGGTSLTGSIRNILVYNTLHTDAQITAVSNSLLARAAPWASMPTPEIAVTATLPTFTPTSPAKLSSLGSVTFNFDSSGASGTITAFAEHYNTVISQWCSLSDVPGARTNLGVVENGVPVPFPAFSARVGEILRLSLDIAAADSASIAPEFLSHVINWTSDVTAPAAPTISKITSVAPSGGKVGYRVDFGDLPDGARHLVFEGKINGGEWLPFSNRAKFETLSAGLKHMAFRGHIDAVEAAGERNELHVSIASGIAIGDVVQTRGAAEDNSENRSSFAVSDPLAIEGQKYVSVPTSRVRLRVRNTRIRLKVR